MNSCNKTNKHHCGAEKKDVLWLMFDLLRCTVEIYDALSLYVSTEVSFLWFSHPLFKNEANKFTTLRHTSIEYVSLILSRFKYTTEY